MGRIPRLSIAAALALVGGLFAAPAFAAGQAPDAALCRDAEALKRADAAVQGGCVVLDRRKGNCMACHLIAGTPSGDIAPPLAFLSARFPDKKRLRAQIEDARRFNPDSLMPPFGTHQILTAEEIDKVVEFLLTL